MSRVDVIHTSTYHTQRNHVSKTKDEIYKYPIIYTVRQNDIRLVWSSINTKGHFGIPKVIMSTGGGCTPIIDYKGEYGMSEFAYAIVDEPDKLPLIQKALMHEDFLKLHTCSWGSSNDKYNPKLIKLLKKDFYLKYI